MNKDSDTERGSRLCVSGSTVEIAKVPNKSLPIFAGGIYSNSGDVARFLTARSTGDIVAQTPVKFCGIVTGVEAYANNSGGTTHAVVLVGMFDLPENKK